MQRREFLRYSGASLLGMGLGQLLGVGCGSGTSATTAAGTTQTTLPFDILARQLRGPLLQPGASGFDQLVAPWNLRFLAQKPAAVARCQNSDDVKTCLAWAQTYNVPLVARSGGHSYAGFSLTPGLMIDLSPMNQIDFDSGSGLARVGGGARNADIYSTLRAPNRAVTHGRCKQVGVGGLVLGGGIGFNMRAHGLTCDQLVETELVTADGQLLTLNSTQNTDLFWACRGAGGGNFGIHTSFTFQTYPVSPLTVYLIRWNSQHRQVLGALADLLPGTPRELGCKVSLVVDSRGTFEVQLLGQLVGSPAQLDALLTPVFNLVAPFDKKIEVRSYWDGQEFLSEEGAPQYSHERSHYVFQPLSAGALDLIVARMSAWPGTGAGADWKFFLQGGAVADRAPNETAFAHRQALMISSIELEWTATDSAKTIALNQAWLNDFHQALQPLTSSSSYQNFIDEEQGDYLHAYYGENLERLIGVKAAIDPKNVFHYPQSIPLAI